MAPLSRMIYKKYGVGTEELKGLMTVYLVYLEKEKCVSRIDERQGVLLTRLGISLEAQ